MRVRVIAGAVVVLGLMSSAGANVSVLPTSYAMLNGQTGFRTYWDDTYAGTGATGNPTGSLSSLAGGLGKLTNGVIGTNNIFDNDFRDWVGWADYNPVVITFDFGVPIALTSVGVHAANNSIGFNDVAIPSVFRLEFSSDGTSFSPAISRTSSTAELANLDSQWLDLGFSETSARFVRYSADDGRGRPWHFYSEFRFTAIPEPDALGLLVPATIFLRRRRA